MFRKTDIPFDNFNAKTTIIQPLRDSTSGSESDTRDPKVWRGSDAWYMIVGSTYDNNGRFLFFKSENLENWEYVNYC
ncbi:sucrose-6-phosphate hydrolase, partial [human gut metagenome]